VEACPAKARIFGDHDDPASELSVLIKKERGQVLNPEFGNKPKVYYLFPR
jgi:molybdopterin-containing oxidoreductase family iron-sulfur binding subunit